MHEPQTNDQEPISMVKLLQSEDGAVPLSFCKLVQKDTSLEIITICKKKIFKKYYKNCYVKNKQNALNVNVKRYQNVLKI